MTKSSKHAQSAIRRKGVKTQLGSVQKMVVTPGCAQSAIRRKGVKTQLGSVQETMFNFSTN